MFDTNELCQIDNVIIEDTNQNLNDVNLCLNSNMKIYMGLKI